MIQDGASRIHNMEENAASNENISETLSVARQLLQTQRLCYHPAHVLRIQYVAQSRLPTVYIAFRNNALCSERFGDHGSMSDKL